MLRAPALLLALTAIACTATPAGEPDAGADCEGCDVVCPAGFVALDGGAGCVALLPAAECPAGTKPTLGKADCTPVGVRACAPGFAPDVSGWGCHDVLPALPCTGATREKLGFTTCAPVSDCAAAFPSAGATLFVSAQYDAGQLDATHFSTVVAAVAAAGAGAVIAIDEGTYLGTVAPRVPVSLVGRCAEKVVVSPGPDAGSGLVFANLNGAVARNLTVRGFVGGVAVFGGSADLSGLVLEDNVLVGLTVSNAGATATLRDSVIRGTRASPGGTAVAAIAQKQGTLLLEEVALSGNEYLAAAATSPDAGLALRRSVVRDTFPLTQGPAAGKSGIGAYVSNNAWLLIEESALLNNTSGGVLASTSGGIAPGSATVRRSTVRDTRASPAFENQGRGVEASNGASVTVEDCTMSGNAEYEVLVTKAAHAFLSYSTTVGAADAAVAGGPGLLVSNDAQAEATSMAFVRPHLVSVEAEKGGRLSLTGSLVTDVVLTPAAVATGSAGLGVVVRTGAALTLVDSVVRRTVGVGLLVDASSATLAQSLVQQTLPLGLDFGRAVSVQSQAQFTATGSAFKDSREISVFAFDPGSQVALTDCSVEDTVADGHGRIGYGVVALTGATLTLTGSTVTGSAGVGVVADEASVLAWSSFISWNGVGVHAQGGSQVVNAEAATLTPNALAVSADTRFVGNGTRIGAGQVPLPSKR
jgi:hypothetical protein